MNVGRIFASAVIRKCAYLLVALVFAFFGLTGKAHAQNAGCGIPAMPTVPTGPFPNVGAALAACNAFPAVVKNGGESWHDRHSNRQCTVNAAAKNIVITYDHIGVWSSCNANYSGPEANKNVAVTGFTFTILCPAGQPWNPATQTCGSACSVDSAPLGFTQFNGGDGASVCSAGCSYSCDNEVQVGFVIDGVERWSCASMAPTGNECSGSEGSLGAPPPDTDGDGTSDANDSAPNNPGEDGGGGEDGEDQGEDDSTTCGGDGQPACEEGQGDGSGEGNTSGGGGNCQSPPASTGDAILAQIAYQTWATRCAIAGLGTGVPGEGGDGEQPDWTKGNAPAITPDDTDYVDEQTAFGIGINTDMLDSENIFGEASCPSLPQFSFFGTDIDTASFTWWCTLISVMRWCILIIGAYTAIQILMGRLI